MTTRRLAVFRHEELLLRRAEAHERHVRAARLDLRGDGGILLKIAVVRAGDDKAGKAVFEIFRRLLGDARLCAEQVNALAELGAALDHARAELDAGHAASERLVQNFCAVHDADAVRQHEVRTVDGGVRRGIRAAGLHNLGIGRHNIVRTLGAQKLFPARKRLVHRHIIKANA